MPDTTKIDPEDLKTAHDFSWALTQLKAGRTVRRGHWEPTPSAGSLGVCVADFIVLVPRRENVKVTNAQKPHFSKNTRDALVETHFARGTLAGMWVLGWMPSMEDLVASDWALGMKEYREYFDQPGPRTIMVVTG